MFKALPFLLIPVFIWGQNTPPPGKQFQPLPQPEQQMPTQMAQQKVQARPPPPPREITPPAGPLGNHVVDIVLDAEFLWWKATCTNLSYATKYEVIDQQNSTNPTASTVLPKKMHAFNWDWDKGVRAGLGLVIGHDGWDIYAEWTCSSINTREHKSLHPIPDAAITSAFNPFGTEVYAHPWSAFGTATIYTEIQARWNILFHQFDLELGRKFWISKALSLRPYGGVRGHLSRMYLKTHGILRTTQTISTAAFLEETDRRTQKVWGVGLVGGLDSAWHMTRNSSVFIDWAIALLYGPFDQHTRFQQFSVTSTGQVTADINQAFNHHDIFTVFAQYNLAMGFRWELPIYDEAFRVRFDAGWEIHLWPSFNQMDLQTSGSTDAGTFIPANGDVTFSGLVLRGRFEF